jgi:FKBP-type peptidyl-prolyl cis-trans isomerase
MKIKALMITGALLCLSQSSHALELSTQKQKYSYTIGTQIGQMLNSQNMTDIDVEALSAAISDYIEKKKPQLSEADMNEALKLQFEKVKAEKEKLGKENLAKGKEFQEKNAKKSGVTVTDSGLQYEVLTPGSGESPKADDKVEVHYKGTLLDGTEFDSSYARGKPVSFSLNGVVPGFKEAVTLMKPGAKWRVVMPPEIAYGEKGAGGKIGPNETLIFEIEYLGLAKQPQAEELSQTKDQPQAK